MEIRFYLKDYAKPADALAAAQSLADKCKAEYEARTKLKCDRWCELTLQDNHPDFTKRTMLDYYAVPIDDFCSKSGLDELAKRVTDLTAKVATLEKATAI